MVSEIRAGRLIMRINRSNIICLAVLLACLCFLGCSVDRNSPVSAQTKKLENGTPATPSANANQAVKNEVPSEIAPRPDIVSREQWVAKDPVGEAKEHTISVITIHHTATLPKKGVSIEKKMKSLQNFSQTESRLDTGKLKPAWFDIPYHFYVSVDGQIAEGRSIKYVGDTNTEYDPTGHALIVLEGNFENTEPSTEQLGSLRALASWLAAFYKVPPADIKAHNDFASTACPGKKLKVLLPSLREKVAESVDSKKIKVQ